MTGPDGESGDSGLDPVTAEVLRSRKYRTLDPGYVSRVVAEVAPAAPSAKATAKLAKRRLQQVYGAFSASVLHRAVDDCIAAIESGTPVREACAQAMEQHRSARSRLPALEPFHRQLTDWIGAPTAVLDLGCGLNPLAIPWMTLADGCRYRCSDIDAALMASLGRLGPVLGVAVEASVGDAREPAALGGDGADLQLMLLLAPTLESQQRGATAAALARSTARAIVLSMPTGTLSGRRAYQRDNPAFVADAAAGSPYHPADQARIGVEDVFLLQRR